MNPYFEHVSLAIILINCVLLALNDPIKDDLPWQVTVDNVLLGLYSAEMVLKILGMGFIMNRNAYLRDYWNILDFIIVVTAYIPLVFNSGSVDLKALRSLRVLRPLRTISSVKSLRTVVTTILTAIPLLINALFILFFVLFIFSIAGLQLFAGLLKKRCFDPVTGKVFFDENGKDIVCGARDCPLGFACGKTTYNPDNNLSNFDTIGNAFVIVFQVITLEGWSSIMYEIMEAFTPISLIYFILLVFIGAYFLLNILLAVIKATFSQNSHSKEVKEELSYDEKYAKLVEATKVNILDTMRRYRAGKGVRSEYFELKTNGTLEQTSKSETSYRSRKTLRDSPLFRKFSMALHKLAPKRIFSRNATAAHTLAPMTTNNAALTQDDRFEPENQDPPTENLEKKDSLLHLDKQATISADRELMRQPTQSDIIENKLTSSGPIMVSAHMNHVINILPAGSDKRIPEVKEESVEGSVLVSQGGSSNPSRRQSVKSRRSTQRKKSTGGPIRPVIDGFTKPSTDLMKPSTDPFRQSLIGIAGINKARPPQSEMRTLEMEDLFTENNHSIPPSELFERSSQTNHYHKPKMTKRKSEKRGKHASVHPKVSLLVPGGEDERSDNLQVSSMISSLSGLDRKPDRESSQLSSQVEAEPKVLKEEAQTFQRKTVKKSTSILKNIHDMEIKMIQRRRGGTKHSSIIKERTDEFEDLNIARADIFDNPDQDKFYIDIRAFKLVPVKSRVYESSSNQAVLPKIFERERDMILKDRLKKIHEKRTKMLYPLLNPNRKHKSGNNEEDPDEKNRFSGSTTQIPIRKRVKTQTGLSNPSQSVGIDKAPKPGLERSHTQRILKKSTNKPEGNKSSINAESQVEDNGLAKDKKAPLTNKNSSSANNVGLNQLGLAQIADDDPPMIYPEIQARIFQPVNEDNDEIPNLCPELNTLDETYLKFRVISRLFLYSHWMY